MYQNKRITELNKRKNGQFSIVLMFRFVFEVKMITHSIKTIIAPVNPCIKFLSFFGDGCDYDYGFTEPERIKGAALNPFIYMQHTAWR